MIDLTPLEVRQKKGDFRRALRGYDEELVNDFLDLVADRMEELVKQNLKLSDRVEALERELVDYREKERELSDALMAAQKLREEAKSHAEKEAELVLREARVRANAELQDSDRAIVREQETLRQIRARRAQLIDSFRRMLERELAELDVIEQTLELQDPLDEGGRRTAARAARAPGNAAPPAGAPAPPATDGPAKEPVQEPAEEPAESAVPPEGAAAEEEGDEGEEQEDWLSSLMEENER